VQEAELAIVLLQDKEHLLATAIEQDIHPTMAVGTVSMNSISLLK